jgi:5'-nucleotidase
VARVRILVTNDDGITSPGIHAVAAALGALGEVWIVAPDRERTAVGHAVTLHKPLRITKMAPRVFMVNGTPVDCVNLALVKVLPGRPSLIVSGINRGVNLGDDVMYSGTVSGALEGTILGIPSIAVSQEGDETFRFDVGAQYAARVAAEVLRHGLPPETILNVNIPNVPVRVDQGCESDLFESASFQQPHR